MFKETSVMRILDDLMKTSFLSISTKYTKYIILISHSSAPEIH